MDFFKFRNVNEENGAGDEGTPSLVAKYKNVTPGQTSAAPARQPARKGDKLNAKMDYSSKVKQDDIKVKSSMKNESFEDPEAQKSEMALTKLHFIEYAAEEIMEYVEIGAPIEEWYQIKLAKVHADMEGLHSYMEGEKRRMGMMEQKMSPVQTLKSQLMTNKDKLQKANKSESYKMIDSMMTDIADQNNMTPKDLHDMWVEKYGKVPDSWIMSEAKMHTSPSGIKTNMDPSDDDYDINYGKNGLAAKFRKQKGVDEGMKPYVSGTAPKSGEKGSYDVIDKNGKVVKSYAYNKGGMQMAQTHLKKIMNEGENKQMKGKDPCWKGYQMVGMKKGKGGKEVPNCVPVTNEAKMDNSEVLSAAKSLAANGKDAKTKSFGKGLVDFYNKNNSFTPDQVAGLQNIMKNASFQMAKEGVMKNIKRQLTGRDANSRAGDEATKMMKAQQAGDNTSATKYNNKFKKLSALTKKEGYASAAQRKAVWASKNEKGVQEKLDPSQGAGEYVKDFQKSDAPQFKGKSKKERQKMAVAAYLGAKDKGD